MSKYITELKEQLFTTINERAKGNKNPEEIKWRSDNKSNSNEEQSKNKQHSSSMDDLKELVDMYNKGLLTDEEFAAMKMKLINGD